MKLTKSNITKLVNNCNKSFLLQGINIIMRYINYVDNGKNALFTLSYENKVFGKVIIYSNGDLVVDNDDLYIHFDVLLERQVEIEQFIILSVHKLLTGQPLEVVITQSISGSIDAKVIMREDGKHTCVRTSVLKQIMRYAHYDATLHIKNARGGSNGSIVVDGQNYNTTNLTIRQENIWW